MADPGIETTKAEIGAKVVKVKPNKKLSAAVRARIERNRQKALLLRQSRLVEKNAKEGSFAEG